MKIKPWHGFIIIAVLAFIGRGFKMSGGEDFLYFLIGTAVFGGIAAGIIWAISKPNKDRT